MKFLFSYKLYFIVFQLRILCMFILMKTNKSRILYCKIIKNDKNILKVLKVQLLDYENCIFSRNACNVLIINVLYLFLLCVHTIFVI